MKNWDYEKPKFECDEINGDLEGLYDYISTMKSDFELINDLDPVSYIKNYITI